MQVNQRSQELKGEETWWTTLCCSLCGFSGVLQFLLRSNTSNAFMHLECIFLEHSHVFEPLAPAGRWVCIRPRSAVPRCSTFGLISTLHSFKLSHASSASLNIYMRQQRFWLWLTGSYAFAASVGVFVFVPALPAEPAPTLTLALTENEPFPHRHHEKVS